MCISSIQSKISGVQGIGAKRSIAARRNGVDPRRVFAYRTGVYFVGFCDGMRCLHDCGDRQPESLSQEAVCICK